MFSKPARPSISMHINIRNTLKVVGSSECENVGNKMSCYCETVNRVTSKGVPSHVNYVHRFFHDALTKEKKKHAQMRETEKPQKKLNLQ